MHGQNHIKCFTYILCKQSGRLKYVQYSLPDDEHKMFETCRKRGELI